MNRYDKLTKTGFHADLLKKIVRQLSGGKDASHSLFQLETTFDDESVFRHLDYLGLVGRILIVVHLDELPVGLRWHASVLPVSSVTSVEVGQISLEESPVHGGHTLSSISGSDLTVFVGFSSVRTFEFDARQCDDPECQADHGVMGASKDEGVTLDLQDGSDETSSPDDGFEFIRQLTAAMGDR